jgi:hypothetical protein
MLQIGSSIAIGRSADAVFAMLTDLDHLSDWAIGIVESRQTSKGPRGKGTTYRMVGKVLFWRIPSVYEVIVYEPPSRFGGKNAGALSFEEIYMLESVAEGTLDDQRTEIYPRGVFKILRPIMARALKKQLDTDLANLKRLLEAQQ